MRINEEEFNEIMSVIVQCQIFAPRISYNKELEQEVLETYKNKKELTKEQIKKIFNDYTVALMLGFINETETFKKIEEIFDRW